METTSIQPTPVEKSPKVVWAEACQRHHDVFVGKFNDGTLTVDQHANYELAMQREKEGFVKALLVVEQK